MSRPRDDRQDDLLRPPLAGDAPEVEYVGRGKARAPYEFGRKVSIANYHTSHRAKGQAT
jgi:hypothetical protein